MTFRQRLDRIRSLTEHSMTSHEDIYWQICSFLNSIVGEDPKKTVYTLDSKIFIRAVSKDKIKWFDNISKLSYLDKEKSREFKKFGRCHWPGEPVFYCSNENGVPVFEIKPSVGHYIAISTWGEKEPNTQFRAVVFGVNQIFATLQEGDPFRGIMLKDTRFQPDTSEILNTVNKILGNLFSENCNDDEKFYWLTSSIAKFYFSVEFSSKHQGIDAIIYPSVASKLSGYNIALSTDFVDQNLILKNSIIYEIKSFEEKICEYKLSPICILEKFNSKGDLHWKDVSEEENKLIWTLNPQSPTVLF